MPPGSTPDVERARDLLVRLAAEVRDVAADVDEAASRLNSAVEPARSRDAATANDLRQTSSTPRLQEVQPLGNDGPMNATRVRDVSVDLRRKYHGRMVHFAQRVQPDFEARLEKAARRWGVKPSDVLRTLVEVHLDPPDEDVPKK